MAQLADPIVPHWLLTALCWLLALEFLILAPLKFYPRGIGKWPSYRERFRNWGFPPWFSFVVGAGEVVAGVMLLLPSRRFLGATILIITLVGAMVTHQINHDKLTDSISAPIHFILVVIVALSTWPVDWRQPLTVAELKSAKCCATVGLNCPAPQLFTDCRGLSEFSLPLGAKPGPIVATLTFLR
jgi:uncharacterized membrane protein YphA (DoxX/SURF4 family)